MSAVYGSYLSFDDPATTEIYTLSLHDALPIYRAVARRPRGRRAGDHRRGQRARRGRSRRLVAAPSGSPRPNPATRSEEHTSELQSHSDLVCRLLLEKKKTKPKGHNNFALVTV